MLNFAATTLNTPIEQAKELSPIEIGRQMEIEISKAAKENRPKTRLEQLTARKDILEQSRRLYGFRTTRTNH